MKCLLLLVGLLPVVAMAQVSTVSANLVNQTTGPSFGTSSCTYETITGYQFNITVQSAMCPSWVTLDTVTNRVSY